MECNRLGNCAIKIATAFLLLCFLLPANAALLAANVIISKGQVSAISVEGETRTLKRRSKVYSGDVIRTGDKGSVQLRFIDKALMTIKANSEMDISNYVLGNENTKEQAIMRLVKGGFRTITGAIGKGNKTDYIVYTPAASIGIRGTNYEVQQEPSGSFVMAVYNGGINVANGAGSIDLGFGGDFNFTRVSIDKPPKGLLLAPASLNANAADDKEELEEESSGEESSGDDTASGGTGNNEAGTDGDTSSNSEKALEDEIEKRIITIIPGPSPLDNYSPFPLPYFSPVSRFEKPFHNDFISDDEWNLLDDRPFEDSSKFGMVMTQNYFNIADNGLPKMNANLQSPNAVTDFQAYDYTSDYLDIDIIYTLYGNSSPQTISLFIDDDVSTTEDLLANINSELSGSEFIASLIDNPLGNGQRFIFEASDSSSDLITSMSLEVVDDYGSPGSVAPLIAQLGGASVSPENDWNWIGNIDLDLFIWDGSWRVDDEEGLPIPGFIYGSEDSHGHFELHESIVAIRNQDPKLIVNDLNDFMACAGQGNICDIQVKDVDASSGIRWGAWLARPGNGVDIQEFDYDSESESDIDIYQDESFLTFGLIAERADINELKGLATFSSAGLTDCSDYSQCIGFGDDGIVSKLSGQFEVDFNNGAVSNGKLNIETMDINTHHLASTWDVDFTGQMYVNEDSRVSQPEFTTNSVGGDVYNAAGTLITNEVIGQVGGIFVKPGDIFAGAYNLATQDSTNKHTTGVFTLEKE